MKKLILIFILLLSFCANAQNFKTHKVKKGETIEQIAKKYLVTPFDIYALNPDAKSELKLNTVLIIPSSRVKNEAIQTKNKEVIGFKTHKVRRKETLFSLSQKYNIDIEQIKKHNSRLYAENLRKGDRIKIPRYKTIINNVSYNNTLKKYKVLPKEGKWRVAYKFGITVPELEALNPKMNTVLQPGDEVNVPNISNNEEKTVEDNFNYYTVLKSEGYMALNRKLGVTKEQLEALNPELKEGGLKLGMVLKVPYDVETSLTQEESVSTNLANNLSNLNAKQIALMLPYRLNRIDVDSVREAKKAIRTNGLLSVSLDFHSGVLLALDSAKRLGISTNLKVFDTRNNASEVSKILNSNNFSSYDAIVGPLMPEHLDRVASDLKHENIPVLSPLTMPKKLYDNVFQTIPSDKLLKNAIINLVKADTLKTQVVIISDSKHKAIANELKSNFSTAKQLYSRKNKDGKEAYFIYQTDLETIFKPGKNIVFLETENEGFASNVISMLNGLNIEDQEIILMTTGINKAFEGKNISNYHLSNLKFHYPSVNKTISGNSKNGFVKAYKRIYGVTPNKYAVRGFDLTLDLLLRLASEDNLFEASSSTIETEYVENKFRYSKKVFGGFFNEAVYVVKFDNLTITEVKQ
ncbi:PBP1 and LysM peptidoglycan-binding domain-containing protein [Ichthyenterobacterium magnum]|uniref:Amino acid/amide ABC transporter substrate-binding protein (HAAT family) n=1 Tax=Ichthyenterobacterium magnum TaxID=1230530 RepID=A0A420DV86_9FLAO|nr:LysM peptidoglycan-binding domain-containing protein [Ichthyenterobacterium magnum]RKE98047.1 amino acid/amide ABC transporter substrate-binding protein (HAAT family) [Ichthyenterobacterium magnum]